MNEDKVENKAEAEDKALPLNLNLNLALALGVVVVLIAGGILLFAQVSSSPGCAGEGPCMLYFYADW
jgi:hypothetical protein